MAETETISTNPNLSRPPSISSDNTIHVASVPAGPGSEDDTPPLHAVNVALRWNGSKTMIWRVLATFWCALVMGSNDAAYGAIIPYTSCIFQLEVSYDKSYTIISLVFLSPFLGYTVSAVVSNLIHQRFGRRGVAFIGPACHLLAFAVISSNPPFPVLVIMYIFVGLGSGIQNAGWNVWISSLANSHEVLGCFHGFYGVGATVSPLIATTLITKAGWHWNSCYYLLTGAAALELVNATSAFWTETGSKYRQDNPSSPGSNGGRSPNQTRLSLTYRVTWICAIFLFLYGGCEVAIGGWIVVFMTSIRHGTPFASGMAETGFWLGITLGRFILGFVSPRIGERLSIIVYIVLAIALELIFWLVPKFIVSAVAVALKKAEQMGGQWSPLHPTFHCQAPRAAKSVCSSNLAFFSEKKIQSLTQKLENTRLKELVDSIEAVIEDRVTARGATSVVYFKRIHPMYPFLDRQSFEETAFSATLAQTLESTPAFSALYHAVLALGCQYHDGGSFDPGKGKAWKFFQMSLGLMIDILVPRESLLSLQALTAMSIFAMNTCCLQIDEILIMEAARMAHALRYHRAICSREQQVWCLRTFWVIYSMEKQLAFQNRENSLIADYNIGCPIPETPEASFGSYNWFLSSIRFARITSQAYELLFSITATQSSTETYYTRIDHVHERLEKWRLAVPDGFRPGESCSPQTFIEPVSKMVALQTHYSYHSMVIALARLTLQIGSDDGARQEDSRRSLMASARRIIELTQYIDKAPHTPLFILAIMPLVALFLLFDFVIHNPTHSETKTNLAMLDIVSGHFALVEHASNGSLPCSLVSEFAHIARQHVRDVNGGRGPGEIMDATLTPAQRPFRGHIKTGSGVDNQQPHVELSGELEPYKHTESVGESADSLYYPAMDASFDFGSDPLLPGIDLRTLFGSVMPSGFDSPEDASNFVVDKASEVGIIRQFKKRHGCLPPPRDHHKDPVLGLDEVRSMLRVFREDYLMEYTLEKYRRHGNTFATSVLGDDDIFTAEPENIKTILAVKFKQFELGETRRRTFHPLLGDGIFAADGPQWEHSRTLLRPSFTRTQIAATDLHERHIQRLISRIPRDGSTVDLQELFFNLTLDTATEFLFGESVESLRPGSSAGSSSFAHHFNVAQDEIAFSMVIAPFDQLIPRPRFRESVREARGYVGNFVKKAIEYRHSLDAEKHAGDTTDSQSRYVFLEELAKETDNPSDITDQILNILLAGRDTTASLLSMVFYNLARRPDIWDLLRSEVATLDGKCPSFEELKQLKYLSWVINETLRLYPVVPSNSRTANEDTFLPVGGGPDGKSPVFVAKGQRVAYDVYVMHRRHDIFGPDAEEFRPERWETIRPGWGYLPFNGGPRICLGQQFALTEASYTTVRIVQSFKEITSRDPEPYRERLALTLASRHGTKVAMVPV
ncbi:cytochrome P450 [Aspergillus minisclerotigenes]|uniref:Cytochrome P450 n=1 Tax=Aspergillus minisclerotigenes TaxID=656917 RepID=A0A5N6J7S7_9EURO|nr:cytochrome P450 [Aspergillus minisclerotigenes]